MKFVALTIKTIATLCYLVALVSARTGAIRGLQFSFSPDPTKTYYIESPRFNTRLASDGNGDPPFSTSSTTTGTDVEWKFISNGNGSWYVQRAAGGSFPRLRLNHVGVGEAVMGDAGNVGANAYFQFTPSSATDNTHYMTLPDTTSTTPRLQHHRDGQILFVASSSLGTWVSFRLTEAEPVGTPTPELKDNAWELGINPYPIGVAESNGGMIGTTMILVSGFFNGYGQSTDRVFSLDTTSASAQWQERDPMPERLSQGVTHGAVVAVGQKFYMCGGYEGGHPGLSIRDCLVFDNEQPAGQQWSSIADLPADRAGGGLIYDPARNSLLFASGAERPEEGNADAFDFTDAWLYSFDNPSSGWRATANIPLGSNHISYVTAQDCSGNLHHYFMGGQEGELERTDNYNEIHEWISATETWVARADMLIPRGHASYSAISYPKSCGFIIIAGATNGGQTSDISYYNIDNDEWMKIGDFARNINTPICAILPDVRGISATSDEIIMCESGLPRDQYSAKRGIGLA